MDFHHDKVHVQTMETAWEQGHTLGILTQVAARNGFCMQLHQTPLGREPGMRLCVLICFHIQ